jgi:hypothetical protein
MAEYKAIFLFDVVIEGVRERSLHYTELFKCRKKFSHCCFNKKIQLCMWKTIADVIGCSEKISLNFFSPPNFNAIFLTCG